VCYRLIILIDQLNHLKMTELLNQHYDTIYRFAYRWCGDQINAQDITQQACIKLANSISQFEFKSSFSSWLYRLVINCAKDFYKSPNTLILVFGKGLTHLQAAKQLDIKESTVSWRIHEARKLLKQTFHSSSFKTDIPTSNTNNVRGSA